MAHRLLSTTVILLACGLAGTQSASADAVPLGTAGSYAVLGGSTITNTGPTVINGDLGLSPGSAVTGFPPGTVNGTMHVNDAAAAQAKADLVIAYDSAAGRASTGAIAADLGGRTLTPGVYSSSSAIGLTGDLTLDAQGNPDATFVFQAGSALTTASSSRVLLIGGAQACNVVWQVGSSATLGTGSTFVGDVLALSSITVTTNSNVTGSVLARNGAVTLDTNNITSSACAAAAPGEEPGTPAPDTDGDGTPDTEDAAPTVPGDGSGSGDDGSGDGSSGPGEEIPSSGPPGTPLRITGPPRCVKEPFWARVRGANIASVTFFLDGKRRKTLKAKVGRTVFVLLIKPAQQTREMHRVTARVRFSNGRPAKTLRLVYERCGGAAGVAVTPQFTG